MLTGPEYQELLELRRLVQEQEQTIEQQSHSTRQRDRINSDEEERMRFGYQLCTAYRFEEHGGNPGHRVANLVSKEGNPLFVLKIGRAHV